MARNNIESFVNGLLLGGLVGGALGLLFAPQSGEETRKYLVTKADDLSALAHKKQNELRHIIRAEIEKVQDEPEKLKEVVEAAIDKFKEQHVTTTKKEG